MERATLFFDGILSYSQNTWQNSVSNSWKGWIGQRLLNPVEILGYHLKTNTQLVKNYSKSLDFLDFASSHKRGRLVHNSAAFPHEKQ